jgi:hypothetical protein
MLRQVRLNQKWVILDESGKVRGRIKKCSYGDAQRFARILFPDLENPGVVAFYDENRSHQRLIASLCQATPRQREIASSLPWLTPQRCVALGVPIEQIHALSSNFLPEEQSASAGGGR